MTLPNFLIIGVAKSGTTWVSRRLDQHPDVFMTSSIYFFDNPDNFAKGPAWYAKCFENATTQRAIGEKTPSYVWGERFEPGKDPVEIAQRVRQVVPNAKLIVVLRNPVTRAISHFNYQIRTGKMSPLLDINKVLTLQHRNGDKARLLPRGFYHRQIQGWLKVFPREQLKAVLLERDIVQRPNECLVDLCKFLNVDPSYPFEQVHEKQNQRLSKAELILKYYSPRLKRVINPVLKWLPRHGFEAAPETYAFLENYYAEENAKLAKLLDLDLSCWNRKAKAAA